MNPGNKSVSSAFSKTKDTEATIVFRLFNIETSVRELRLITFASGLSIGCVRLDSFAWTLSIDSSRLKTFIWEFPLGRFTVETFVWKLLLGSCCLELFEWVGEETKYEYIHD